MGDVTLWVEENETQSVWNMLSAMAVLAVPVKVKPALVIDADEETAHLVRKCLEASGLRMAEEAVSHQLSAVSQEERLRTVCHMDFAQMADEAERGAIEQHEALMRLGAVIENAANRVQREADEIAAVVLAEKPEEAIGHQPSAFSEETEPSPVAGPGLPSLSLAPLRVVVAAGEGKGMVCEVCGGALYGRRKSAKVCSSEECQKEAQRRYAREYYQKNNSKKAKKKEGGEVKQEEKKAVAVSGPRQGCVAQETAERAKQMVAHAFPWKMLDGERAGKCVTARVMASLLDRKKVKPGWRVEHVENGLFVVAKRSNGSGAECVYELEPSHE